MPTDVIHRRRHLFGCRRHTPANYINIGAILADLNLRRGQILGQEIRGDANVIRATVPLMNMFGYASALREMSKGQGSFTMQFDHYAPAYRPDDDPFRPAVGMRF
jgi:elongation factor G